MYRELIEVLRCPASGTALSLTDAVEDSGRIRSGILLSDAGARYEIRDFIPRFVPLDNYAASFGLQWNRFAKTQLDSHSGVPVSSKRFWKATGWHPEDLRDKWVLDVGCGAGRFAEIVLEAGARLVAIDYSTAVDACFANLGSARNLHVLQADIYALPFARHAFSFVYSLGVLQHTPDVARAFASLPPLLVSGGRLCVDSYHRSWKSRMLPKYWLRPFTKHVDANRLFSALEAIVPSLYPVSAAAGRLPGGALLKRAIPVADPVYYYEREYGKTALTRDQRLQWALLDTFDWLSPRYDTPQTVAAIEGWLKDAGLHDIEVQKAGHMVGRGTAP
jgi:SAM-dependent methyltransferase